jgi:hypothetical protein
MQPIDDVIDQWELIVSEANKTDVPLECIKKIIIKLPGGQKRSINLHTLLKQGMDIEEIENMISRTFSELGTDVRDVDFVIDIRSVAAMVQPETDKILGKL